MNKELTKEEAEEFYNKLWLENKDLIQENMNKLSMERFELELELVDKNKEIERLNNIINELDNMFYEAFRISQNGYYSISEWELKEFTDKIKELKGSDKE